MFGDVARVGRWGGGELGAPGSGIGVLQVFKTELLVKMTGKNRPGRWD